MLPVIVELPLDRTEGSPSYDCRPRPSVPAQRAVGTGLGCNELAGGRTLSAGVLRPLKPSQELSSMHFGTAHSALDRLEGGD